MRNLLIGSVVLLALAACSTAPQREDQVSACAQGETSYECQIERYLNVNGD